MKSITILSAAPFEASHAINVLTKLGIEVEYEQVGIGPLNAAKNAAHVSGMISGKDVVFLGTCGVFAGFSGVKLVTPFSVKWLPACERIGASSSIENLYPPFKVLPFEGDDLPQVEVICSSNVSYAPDLPRSMRPTHTVENLELYSLLPEVTQTARSFRVIFAITNEICDDARTQWKENFQKASRMTGEYLSSHFEKLLAKGGKN